MAGTRSDLQKDGFDITDTKVWQKQFPEVPMVNNIISISTKQNQESARQLFSVIETECTKIMDAHCKITPSAYKELLKDIKSIPSTNHIINLSDILAYNTKWQREEALLHRALRYLHAIGLIVFFTGDKVCTKPEVISQIMAKFISPQEVRNKLLWDNENQVKLLTQTDVDAILEVNTRGNTR